MGRKTEQIIIGPPRRGSETTRSANSPPSARGQQPSNARGGQPSQQVRPPRTIVAPSVNDPNQWPSLTGQQTSSAPSGPQEAPAIPQVENPQATANRVPSSSAAIPTTAPPAGSVSMMDLSQMNMAIQQQQAHLQHLQEQMRLHYAAMTATAQPRPAPPTVPSVNQPAISRTIVQPSQSNSPRPHLGPPSGALGRPPPPSGPMAMSSRPNGSTAPAPSRPQPSLWRPAPPGLSIQLSTPGPSATFHFPATTSTTSLRPPPYEPPQKPELKLSPSSSSQSLQRSPSSTTTAPTTVRDDEELRKQHLDRYAEVYVPQWLKDVNSDSNFAFHPLEGQGQQVVRDDMAADYAQSVWPTGMWEKLRRGESIVTKGELETDQLLQPVSSSWLGEGGLWAGDSLEGELLEDESQPIAQADWSGSSANGKTVLGSRDKEAVSSGQPQGAQKLGRGSYGAHWKPLLTRESDHRALELVSHAVYAQTLQIYTQAARAGKAKWDPDGLYTLALPGIREERPRLFAGDRLHLRPLASVNPMDLGGQPGWLHLCFEAKVTAVRAIQGEIVISCPALKEQLATSFPNVASARFNVQFVYDGRLLDNAVEAVDKLSSCMATDTDQRSDLLRRWLFPTSRDANMDNVMHSPADLTWYDDGLNPEQQSAVYSISQRDHSIPFLLSGPPGTGKTKTSIEAILQILKRDPQRNKVLVVAPSNAASDVLAIRLSAHLKPGELLRINDPTRTFAEVPEKLSMYTYTDAERNCFALPSWRTLMKAKVVVTACHDVPLLLKSRVASNADLGELQLAYLPGVRPFDEGSRSTSTVQLHWTHLLVDEAAQGTEPDLAPAFDCVLPHRFAPRGSRVPTVILVGDPAQLGPQIRDAECRSQGLDVSLLERLSKLPVYSRELVKMKAAGRAIVLAGGDSTSSRRLHDVSNGYNSASKAAVPSSRHCGHLVRNYRARHPSLLHLPSNLFYSDSLIPASAPTSRSLQLLDSWSLLPRRGIKSGIPMVFYDVRTEEEWTDEGVSWYNLGETQQTGIICSDLVRGISDSREGLVKPQDVAVITPFREQVWRIRIHLRELGLGGISVGPLEAFQGQEAPIMILSLVRSLKVARFLDEDRKNGNGLIGEGKKLNVALTRAREGLVVVGNMETASGHCEDWRRVVGHAVRNGWVVKGKGTEEQDSSIDPFDQGNGPRINGHQEETIAHDQEISALEYAQATNPEGSWWQTMLNDYHRSQGSESYNQPSSWTEINHQPGDDPTDSFAAMDEEDRRMHLLAGRMATIALQGDEAEGEGEEEEDHQGRNGKWSP